MIIVCATDDNFVQHCSIMLVSLLCNNKDVEIYVLTEGLKHENEKIIQEEVEHYNGRVHFCLVDSSIVEKFPMPSLGGLNHISRATYYRLMIAELLPSNVHKAIYLDCDMIVNHRIDELWNLDLNGYALAASLQIGFGYEALRLGYPIEYGYFNAGMNVLNLDYFREHNVSQCLIDYISNNYSKIKYHDQDTLNAVLYDKTYHLLPQWNMTSIIYSPDLVKFGDSVHGIIVNKYELEKANAIEYRTNPIILHYVSTPKPWQKNCTHPLCGLYFQYAKKTKNFCNIKQQTYLSLLPALMQQKLRRLCSTIKQSINKTDPRRL